MNRYENRRVLITGAGSGIGQATVLRLLDEGAHVVAADVSPAGLEDTQKRANSDRLKTVVVDIGDEASVVKGVAEAKELLGGLDAVVNAAAILRAGHSHEFSAEDFLTTIRVNLLGTFLVIREAIPHLLEGVDPAVVNFSSTSANFAHPYLSAYSASKGGIQSMTHSLAAEYSEQGIRFVSVQPGGISTGMTDATSESKLNSGLQLPEGANFGLFSKMAPAIGEGLGRPEKVASVVAMLASTDAAFITGTEVRVDGGAHH